MALEMSVINKSQNKLTQKVFVYIEGQQDTTNIKQLESGEIDRIEIPVTEKNMTKDIVLSYLNTDSAIIIKKIGQIESMTQIVQLEITDITREGTIKYDIT
ncbi:hypothetical protein UE46_15935 [Listeria weihenstephanensis]|uniref:Uncharacterized protein n=1 Tax=Listeria weihenstephanensis TaxID=1006155 RepID=A0A1S7FY49_9LIST|nr:hypothetical protein [Listeria weihenstephanensis]AQY52354.1 hypothetical protein UE46_15935 [Listeria weihenstephanensis]